MKNSGIGIFLLTLANVFVLLVLPSIAHSALGDSIGYAEVAGFLFGITLLGFGAWLVYERYVKHPTLKEQDRKFLVQLETAKDAAKLKERKPSFRFEKLFFGALFWAVIICTVVSCEYNMVASEEETAQSVTVWNADNIPLPHLRDGSQYVSNPDTLLSQATVDTLNAVLRRLDDEVGIESAVIIVNHIENQDAFRMAQDVGNKYGIGNKETDRGLVIVVAYEDHQYFIAPGRGLEGMLTDAECSRLARTYLTPYLRVYNPDGGMKSLVSATYALAVEKKALEEPTDDDLVQGRRQEIGDDDISSMSFGFLILWFILYGVLNTKYHWVTTTSSGTGYTGYGRNRMGGGSATWGTTSWGHSSGGFGGGFGGGGFGGGYGGGSFGGGGAGGSW